MLYILIYKRFICDGKGVILNVIDVFVVLSSIYGFIQYLWFIVPRKLLFNHVSFSEPILCL